MLALLAVGSAASCSAPGLAAQKKPKPKKEEITQTLQLPKELPTAVIGETRRLTFHVTPSPPADCSPPRYAMPSRPSPAKPAPIPC